jgi:hypothetical protein
MAPVVGVETSVTPESEDPNCPALMCSLVRTWAQADVEWTSVVGQTSTSSPSQSEAEGDAVLFCTAREYVLRGHHDGHVGPTWVSTGFGAIERIRNHVIGS